MGEQKAAQITISLSKELLDFADHLAIEQSTSRSGVFARLLEKEEEARVQALMAKGYSKIGEENRREAEEALNLTNEALHRSLELSQLPSNLLTSAWLPKTVSPQKNTLTSILSRQGS